MTENRKKILTVVCILILLAIVSLYLVIKSEGAKITTFEECEKAGWLVRSITVYDGPAGSPEKKCELWSGKSFIKEGVGQLDSVNVSSVPFFPVQKEPATSYMQALLGADNPEELIIKDGCLRAGGFLLVWPYGFSLSADNGTFQVIDSTGQIVARVGDKIKVGGGADETPDGRVARGYSAQLPSDRCSGPYWIVGEVITVDKSTSSVATTPLSPEQKKDFSKIKKYPREGDYLSSEGHNTKILLSGGEYPTTLDSKILLLNYSLNYTTLRNEDICLPYTANQGDPGILIRGTLKNEYDRDYWITLGAAAYDSTENLLGRSLDSGPICGVIARYVKSNETENFELHLKYSNAISKINLSGGLSEIMPP